MARNPVTFYPHNSGFSFSGATMVAIAPVPPACLKLLPVHPTTYPILPLELSNMSSMNPYLEKTSFLSQPTMILTHRHTKLCIIKKFIHLHLIVVHVPYVLFNMHTYIFLSFSNCNLIQEYVISTNIRATYICNNM